MHEYLLGRDILVAPVITKGAVNRKVYLPQDQWIHIWSGDEHQGGRTKMDAPIGKPPVFVRKSSEWLMQMLEIGKL